MNAISFVYTSAALLAGAKTVTRREWQPLHAARFRCGDTVLACDRRLDRGGIELAHITLTHQPTFEPMIRMPDSDYEAEGFAWLYEHPEYLPRTIGGLPASRDNFSRSAFDEWREGGGSQWVIRFRLIEVIAFDYLSSHRSASQLALF